MGVIYTTTSRINGKVYVGKTSRSESQKRRLAGGIQ